MLMKQQEMAGMACLVLTSLIWGFAFVSQVQGMASMSPLFFNATRFTLGGDLADPVAAVEAFATMPGIGEDGWRGEP